MSADQTRAADPTPGSSRVDVAGLRAAAEAATPGPWCHDGLDGWVATWDDGMPVVEGIEMWAETDAAFIAAADPTTVLALLDERDDLAARLATAEAELSAITEECAEYICRHGEKASEGGHWCDDMGDQGIRPGQTGLRFRRRSPWGALVVTDLPRKNRAALAPLDPDAPTGHDGQGDQPEGGAKWDGNRRREPIDPQQADALMQQRLSDGHGDPDTHQGDTEAACSTCAYLDRLGSMNPSESLRRDIVEVRDRHMAEAHQGDTEAGA